MVLEQLLLLKHYQDYQDPDDVGIFAKQKKRFWAVSPSLPVQPTTNGSGDRIFHGDTRFAASDIVRLVCDYAAETRWNQTQRQSDSWMAVKHSGEGAQACIRWNKTRDATVALSSEWTCVLCCVFKWDKKRKDVQERGCMNVLSEMGVSFRWSEQQHSRSAGGRLLMWGQLFLQWFFLLLLLLSIFPPSRLPTCRLSLSLSLCLVCLFWSCDTWERRVTYVPRMVCGRVRVYLFFGSV